jgi:hypothetical protein
MSSLSIILGNEGVAYLHCTHGYGSLVCDSYIEVTHEGAFHFCTTPSPHGLNMSLTDVLELAQTQGHEIEKAVLYTIRKKAEARIRAAVGHTQADGGREAATDQGVLHAGEIGDRSGLSTEGPIRVLNNTNLS